MSKFKTMAEKIDKKVLIISAIICFVFLLYAGVAPDAAGTAFSNINSFIVTDFGWLYLLSVAVFVVFMFVLAFSKFGKIKLGKDDEEPEYKRSSWFFMLFAAGMGIGLCFYSLAEPISHFMSPPLDSVTPESAEAAKEGMRLTFMHWGLHPWACFGIVGLPLAYFAYRKNKPMLISSCLIPVIGEKGADGAIGKAVNILAVFATVFGVATSLGLGSMQVNSGLDYVFGTPNTVWVKVILIVIVTCIFILSAVSGISKGIKRLSTTNMILAAIILLTVFFVGKPLFVADLFTESIGNYISGIVKQSFWTDAFGETGGWLGGWTVFYWAWWIAWGPFVGAFIARISRGRTIREFVIGVLILPTIIGFIFISVLGGNALFLELGGNHAVTEATAQDISYSVFAMFEQIPLTVPLSILFMFLIWIFFITSADSATFACSMFTARGVQEPPSPLRVFWGVVTAATAIYLLLIGGLNALQTASIIGAFPFMFVCLWMMYAFFKEMRLHGGDPVLSTDAQGLPKAA
ncbi:MAG: BCCT family transporter [Clostridiales Family XIII bacterium]|jgi:glycine betaine transporter|nr:BCCT family transporter [Clostridiales Family XIII bacterium]